MDSASQELPCFIMASAQLLKKKHILTLETLEMHDLDPRKLNQWDQMEKNYGLSILILQVQSLVISLSVVHPYRPCILPGEKNVISLQFVVAFHVSQNQSYKVD